MPRQPRQPSAEPTADDLRDLVVEEFVQARAVPEALQPRGAFRVSRDEFVKETRAYPREAFRGDYFRVIHGADEHYEALLAGWVDEKTEGQRYLPISASPEAIEKAKAQIAAVADKAAAEKAKKDGAVVSMDQVQAMIEAALQADRANR